MKKILKTTVLTFVIGVKVAIVGSVFVPGSKVVPGSLVLDEVTTGAVVVAGEVVTGGNIVVLSSHWNNLFICLISISLSPFLWPISGVVLIVLFISMVYFVGSDANAVCG